MTARPSATALYSYVAALAMPPQQTGSSLDQDSRTVLAKVEARGSHTIVAST